jgi:hypothetical protein
MLQPLPLLEGIAPVLRELSPWPVLLRCHLAATVIAVVAFTLLVLMFTKLGGFK